MNCYEHTLVIKSDLSESNIKILYDKYSNIITNNSGKIVKSEVWGLRPLSYKIKKSKKAFYYHIKFEGNGEIVAELENTGNIDNSLLRFLTVKVLKHDTDTNYFESTSANYLEKKEV